MTGFFSRAAKSFIVELLIGLSVFALLSYFVPLPENATIWAQGIHHIGILIISLVIPIGISVARGRNSAALLIHFMRELKGRRVGPIVRVHDQGMIDLKDTLNRLQYSPGAQLNSTKQLDVLYESCFALAHSNYIGVDTNQPSEYMKKYSSYLHAHKESRIQNSVRILAVSKDMLRSDFEQHVDIFNVFVEWHISNGVLLLQVENKLAKDFTIETNTPTPDVALWCGNYAVLFDGSDGAIPRIQFLECEERGYGDAELYINLVLRQADALEIKNGTLGFVLLPHETRLKIISWMK